MPLMLVNEYCIINQRHILEIFERVLSHFRRVLKNINTTKASTVHPQYPVGLDSECWIIVSTLRPLSLR